jgi:hypothetical protein
MDGQRRQPRLGALPAAKSFNFLGGYFLVIRHAASNASFLMLAC